MPNGTKIDKAPDVIQKKIAFIVCIITALHQEATPMIKFIVKSVIVLLALQSAMNYLRKQDIIEGSIEINYPIVQQKLVGSIPAKKIAAGLFEVILDKIQSGANNNYQATFPARHDQVRERNPHFKIVEHVVDRGETLNELAQRYGVHWRVIQRVNHLADGRDLFVGQRLKIPSKMHQLI